MKKQLKKLNKKQIKELDRQVDLVMEEKVRIFKFIMDNPGMSFEKIEASFKSDFYYSITAFLFLASGGYIITKNGKYFLPKILPKGVKIKKVN